MTADAQLPDTSCAATFRVGKWTVDPALHRISSGGRTLKIEPKAMAVLAHLAERQGQVVSREALLSAVWSGVVVGDDALTQVIVKLRKALGDVREEPAYIQTIAKGGYRLVAPVVRTEGVAPERGKPRLFGRTGAAVALLLLLLAGTAWWLRGEQAGDASRLQTPDAISRSAREGLPEVSVRPFEALGNDPLETVLARGMTADLVTDLSKVSGLWVVLAEPKARQPADETAGRPPPGRYLVSGTVQRMDDRMRLQVHLIDAETGKQLWSERFDRVLSGIFEIQDELGPRILQLLPVKVGETETRRVAQRYTRNLEAYEAFQRGRFALHVRKKAENAAAREAFRRAIDLDPAFARAYAGLAMTYVADYRNQWTGDGAAALDRAFELARTAHQINQDIAETYWALAMVHVHRQQHDQALAHLESALRLYPSFADAYAMMGGIYTSVGRPQDGVPLLRTAIRLAPESGYLYLMLLGRAYFSLGDLEQARTNLQHSLLRNPEFLDARVYLAAVQLAAGDKAAAAWEAEEIRALQPGFTVRRWLETNPTADARLRQGLERALGELGF